MVAREDPSLPRLAWYAELDAITGVLHVEHGSFVEVDRAAGSPAWVSAAVWDAPFAQGRFHESPHVFGSGVRIEGDEVHFVPSSTMLGRLFYLRGTSGLQASNSLVVMLARLGARLSRSADHSRWGEGTCFGRFEYDDRVPIEGGGHDTLRMLMFDSLVVGPHGVRHVDRSVRRCFAHFDEYHEALRGALAAIWSNAADGGRRQRLRAVSNASRGYDSLTVTALAVEHGPVTSYTAARSNTRVPAVLARRLHWDVVDDDGSELARRLGAEPAMLDPTMAKIPASLERWMWSSAQVSPELVFWSLLRDADEAAGDGALTVWFSGHGGDLAWETACLDPRIVRGGVPRGTPSGLPHAEVALQCGIVDCTVPFLFGTSYDSVLQVTNSDEMAPWRLGNLYDRPIPRRILESRGLRRHEFGFGKKMVAQDMDVPQGVELRQDFFAAGQWNPLLARAYRGVNFGLYGLGRARTYARLRLDHDAAIDVESLPKNSIERLAPVLGLRRATFLYCVDELVEQLRSRLDPSPMTERDHG